MKPIFGLFLSLFFITSGFAQNYLASAYPSDYHGTILYSGERYSKFIASGASNFIAQGSKILLTELNTGRSVLVKINDKLEEAQVDFLLSDAVFKELGISSDERIFVKYRLIEGTDQVATLASSSALPADEHLRTKGEAKFASKKMKLEDLKNLNSDYFTLQISAFSTYDKALNFIESNQDNFQDQKFFINTVKNNNDQSIHRVLIGYFDQKSMAVKYRDGLQEKGYSPFVVSIGTIQ